MRPRRGLTPGQGQYLRNRLNKIDEARRRRQAQGGSILDQASPVVTPIIRYRHTCQECHGEFVADSQEATCRYCHGNKLTFNYVPKEGARD